MTPIIARLPSVSRRNALAAVAAAALLALPACGGSGSGHDPSKYHHGDDKSGRGATVAATAFNEADVAFAAAMIPHHQQAIEMAAMAESQAAAAEVKALAATISAAQQPEMDTMHGWLAAWGRAAMMHQMNGDASMPGMMSDADMAKLAQTTGAAFDKQFLTMMISHHEGAIEMARQETAQGSSPEAVALAKKIITDQQAEITAMQSMLRKG